MTSKYSTMLFRKMGRPILNSSGDVRLSAMGSINR